MLDVNKYEHKESTVFYILYKRWYFFPQDYVLVVYVANVLRDCKSINIIMSTQQILGKVGT